jgi:hypothetical protein
MQSLECCQKEENSRKSFEKIQTGNQFVISKLGSGLRLRFQKLGSGASSSFLGFRGLAFDKTSSEEGV